MWKVTVALLLLLHMDLEVNGAVDKASGAMTERRINKEEAQPTSSFPARHVGSTVFLGKLLVVPMDGSHWVGIKAIAQEMGRRGHQVTVVIPELSLRMGPGKHYDTLTYPVPYDKAYMDSVLSSHKDHMEKNAQSFIGKIRKRYSQFQKITGFIHITAESLLFNASLISHLAQQVSIVCNTLFIKIMNDRIVIFVN